MLDEKALTGDADVLNCLSRQEALEALRRFAGLGFRREGKEPMDDDAPRMNDDQKRDRVLGEFNQSMLDPVGPVGPPERQMKVLGEMNELAEHHE